MGLRPLYICNSLIAGIIFGRQILKSERVKLYLAPCFYLYVTHLHKISRIAHFSENEIYDAIMFKRTNGPFMKLKLPVIIFIQI